MASSIDRGGARQPLIELTLARLREFTREPEAVFWTFGFPIVIAVILGLAFPRIGAKPVVIGLETGEGSTALRQAIVAVPGITVRDLTPGDEGRALRQGEVHLVIIATMPPTYRFDPARDESRVARLVVDDILKRAAGRRDPWQATEEPVQVAGSRYVDWLMPGVIGMNIMGTSMWGLGFSIVQVRMRNLLKRLVASPMKKREYLTAQVCARMVFLAPEVAVPLTFGAFVLGMPVRGSVGAIAVVCIIGALAFGALGLLTASRARTFEAISGILNLTMLPMWVLSGVFFSASNFPAIVQPFVQALPLTALINALREVILEGATLAAVKGELILLAAWGIIPFAVALRVFRWR